MAVLIHAASKSKHESDGTISNHGNLKIMPVSCAVVKMLGPEPTNICVYAWFERHEGVLCESQPWRTPVEKG